MPCYLEFLARVWRPGLDTAYGNTYLEIRKSIYSNGSHRGFWNEEYLWGKSSFCNSCHSLWLLLCALFIEDIKGSLFSILNATKVTEQGDPTWPSLTGQWSNRVRQKPNSIHLFKNHQEPWLHIMLKGLLNVKMRAHSTQMLISSGVWPTSELNDFMIT